MMSMLPLLGIPPKLILFFCFGQAALTTGTFSAHGLFQHCLIYCPKFGDDNCSPHFFQVSSCLSDLATRRVHPFEYLVLQTFLTWCRLQRLGCTSPKLLGTGTDHRSMVIVPIFLSSCWLPFEVLVSPKTLEKTTTSPTSRSFRVGSTYSLLPYILDTPFFTPKRILYDIFLYFSSW